MGFKGELVSLCYTIVGGTLESVGLERLFSTFGFTYGKLRGELGVEKAGKLAFFQTIEFENN